MKRELGFTLVELVIVIIILGILSATALPRFVNLSGDAKKAALLANLGALKAAVILVHSKAQITGATGATGTDITIGADSTGAAVKVQVKYGYPYVDGTTVGNGEALFKALVPDADSKLSYEDIAAVANTNEVGVKVIYTDANANCYFEYKPPAAANAGPQYTFALGGVEC